jgi:non-ribosomal peptide synthetase component F
MVILQNQWESGLERTMGDLKLTVEKAAQQTAGFDLAFEFSEQADGLHLALNFNTDIYSARQVDQLMDHLQAFLHAVVNNPNDCISAQTFLSDHELSILEQLSGHHQLMVDSLSLPEYFSQTVNRFPEKTAIVHQDREYTFKELDLLSDRLSQHITNKWHPHDEELIAILLPRSEWWVVGIIAVWKAGAAYLPLDLTFPVERLDFILKDSQTKHIIDSDFIKDFLNSDSNEVSELNISVPPVSKLAYCIYTSGSTGKPKGVLVEHRGIVAMLLSQIDCYGLKSDDRILQFSSLHFDASLEQIGLSLVSGACLFIPTEEELLEPHLIQAFLHEHQVTHLNAVPAYLEQLSLFDLPSLRRVVSGGDLFSPSLQSLVSKNIDVFNVYGPTEATVSATSYKLSMDAASPFPIGNALNHVAVHLWDAAGIPVPVGAAAVICLAGLINALEISGKNISDIKPKKAK